MVAPGWCVQHAEARSKAYCPNRERRVKFRLHPSSAWTDSVTPARACVMEGRNRWKAKLDAIGRYAFNRDVRECLEDDSTSSNYSCRTFGLVLLQDLSTARLTARHAN